jgi:hypothetical protein
MRTVSPCVSAAKPRSSFSSLLPGACQTSRAHSHTSAGNVHCARIGDAQKVGGSGLQANVGALGQPAIPHSNKPTFFQANIFHDLREGDTVHQEEPPKQRPFRGRTQYGM